MPSIKIHRFDNFNDPVLNSEVWEDLLSIADTRTVFLTYQYQRAWWDSFGRGQLHLIAAEQDGQWVALAPLFSEAGMLFFVGSGGSDYLDFVGRVDTPEVLMAILDTARRQVPDFLGFRFYHVPDASKTGRYLQEVAARLQLVCYDEGDLAAPALDLVTEPQKARAVAEKKSLVRHEKFFRREGRLTIHHLHDGESILPQLECFFAQHMRRWEMTPYPSLFHDPKQHHFYRRLTEIAGNTGWLRFTRVDWNGEPVAFHFGFCYQSTYLWYKPSFAIEWAHRSPGEVLLRQLLLAALAEEAHTFDFGLGDEPFKRRFTSHIARVRTWGLYPVAGISPA